MIHIGIIGCGKIAQTRHLPEYAANKDVVIDGIFDMNTERAKTIADVYNTRAFASWEELLAYSSIDAVSICTANTTHSALTIAALSAQKHVLCEKPMGITLDECEAMVKTAKDNKRFLMIGHNQRLTRTHQKAKELLLQGIIGNLCTFSTSFRHSGPETWTIDPGQIWFFDKQKASMGVMADLGIHKTDIIQYLTGQHITQVTAQLCTLDKKKADDSFIEVDDNAFCIYKLENGITGTMAASWSCYGPEDNSTVLYGTEGVMYLYTNPAHSLIIERKNGERILYTLDKIQTNETQTKSGVIDTWLNCLRKNIPPEISGEEVLHSMRAVFAATTSAQTGTTINIL